MSFQTGESNHAHQNQSVATLSVLYQSKIGKNKFTKNHLQENHIFLFKKSAVSATQFIEKMTILKRHKLPPTVQLVTFIV